MVLVSFGIARTKQVVHLYSLSVHQTFPSGKWFWGTLSMGVVFSQMFVLCGKWGWGWVGAWRRVLQYMSGIDRFAHTNLTSLELL